MMDLDELQSVQSRERQTDSLQQLRETFYRDAGEYIEGLRAERERAAECADDPWNDPEISRLSDDIETAEGTVEAIYERRVGKIVKMASLAAADVPTEDDGLTDEERRLFESLVSEIERSRDRVEALLDGQSPPPVPDDADGDGGDRTPGDRPPADGDATSRDVDAASLMGEGTAAGTGESTGSTREPPPERPPDAGGDAETETDAGVAQIPDHDDHGEASDADAERGPQSSRDAERTPDRGSDASGGSVTSRGPTGSDGVGSGGTRSASGGGSGNGGTTPESAAGSVGGAGVGGRESSDPDPDGDVDRWTVRITADVGEIFGVEGRSYDLSATDVVTLPEANAEPLVERDAAERLD